MIISLEIDGANKEPLFKLDLLEPATQSIIDSHNDPEGIQRHRDLSKALRKLADKMDEEIDRIDTPQS